MNTTPRNSPVGGLNGGWQTNTWPAMLGVSRDLVSRRALRPPSRSGQDHDLGRHHTAGRRLLVRQQPRQTSASSSSIARGSRSRWCRGISPSRSARSSYSISSSTLISRSRSSPSIKRSCSDSGSSSSTSANRSSSIASASCWRCARGRAARRRRRRRGACRGAGGLGGHRARRGEQAGHLVAARPGGSSGADGARCRPPGGPWRPPTRSTVRARGPQRDVAHRLVADSPVDHLAADQHLTRPWLERVQIDVPAAQPRSLAVERADAVGVDEDAPPLARRDEPDDLGQRAPALPRNDDDVLEPADRAPASVEQWQAHHPECVDQIACHGRRLALDLDR